MVGGGSGGSSSSVTSRRIVQAFIDFLLSVDASQGDDVDVEALEVAKDCLTEAFKLHLLPHSERPQPNLLLNLFTHSHTHFDGVISQPDANADPHFDGLISQPDANADTHFDGVISQPDANADTHFDGVISQPDANADDSAASNSKDQLFGHFFHALDNIHFFNTTGDDENVLLDRATSLFHLALNEMQISGTHLLHPKNLADALKVLGNKSMHSNSYFDAIERYTCAIALDDTNAVYYSNRAAAYTQVHKYNEAIIDCLKSVEIDPSYCKAYSRMGLAYYAQGKYSDAINKGFRKALELDPNNDAVKENIRVAENKLIEEREQRNRYQNSGYNFGGASGDGTASSSAFSSIPANLTSMFSNLAGNASQDQRGQGRAAEDNNGTRSGFVDGNTVPATFTTMVENLGRAFMERDSESPYSEQNPFGSVSDLAGIGMSMNMSGQSSDQQGQGSNVGNANFSFSFGGETPEELNRAFSSMMGMFPGASQGGNPQGNTDSR